MTLKIGPDDQDLSHRVASVLPHQRGVYWGGEWHEPSSASTLTTHNPSTGEVLAGVLTCGAADVDAAGPAAKAACPSPARRCGPHSRTCRRTRADRCCRLRQPDQGHAL